MVFDSLVLMIRAHERDGRDDEKWKREDKHQVLFHTPMLPEFRWKSVLLN
jgi:hypothetical protein